MLPGGSRQARYFAHYAVKSEKIKSVNMTVDVVGIQEYASTLTKDDRNIVRRQYGIQETDVVFLYVAAWCCIKEF